MLIMTCLPAFTTHAYHRTADSQVWTKTDNAVLCDARTEVITTAVTRSDDGSYEYMVSDLTCLFRAHESDCATITKWKITYVPGDVVTGYSKMTSEQQDD